jgi:hypothetical protein
MAKYLPKRLSTKVDVISALHPTPSAISSDRVAPGVIIPERLGIAECLQDGVGLQEDLLHGLYTRAVPANCGNIVLDLF